MPKAGQFRHKVQFWCTQCLAKVGGYGGSGGKSNNKNLTCSQLRALPQQQARLRRQWSALKHKTPANGEPLWQQLSQWVRDLVQDGDVEPNPGPGGSSRKYPSRQVRVCNLNASGPAGMWSLLRQMASDVDVFLCQETAFTSASAIQAFEHAAYKKGFRYYGQPGTVGHRGVGILARKQFRCKFLQAWGREDAQAVAVQVQGIVFISLYVSCNGQAPELLGEVLNFLTVAYSRVPWVLCGDHNETPQDNVFSQLLVHEGGHLLAVPSSDHPSGWAPTRFEGDRAIDYAVTNRPDDVENFRFHPLAISDHKILSWTMRAAGAGDVEPTWRWTKSISLTCPESVESSVWAETIKVEWSRQSLPPVAECCTQEDVDTLWDETCVALQDTLRRAQQSLCPEQVRIRRGQGKNCVHMHKTPVPQGPQCNPHSTFRERALQNAIFRLCELRRLEQRGQIHTPAYHALLRKLQRFPGLPAGSIQKADLTRFVKHLCMSRDRLRMSRFGPGKTDYRTLLRLAMYG